MSEKEHTGAAGRTLKIPIAACVAPLTNDLPGKYHHLKSSVCLCVCVCLGPGGGVVVVVVFLPERRSLCLCTVDWITEVGK